MMLEAYTSKGVAGDRDSKHEICSSSLRTLDTGNGNSHLKTHVWHHLVRFGPNGPPRPEIEIVSHTEPNELNYR